MFPNVFKRSDDSQLLQKVGDQCNVMQISLHNGYFRTNRPTAERQRLPPRFIMCSETVIRRR
jgi:hypothetical protein